MNKTRLLWALVAIDVLLAFGSVGADAFFAWTLPPTLAVYEHSRFHGLTPWGTLQLLMLAMASLCAFAAWIGLVSFWRYARELYIVSWAMWIFYVLISGPRVSTSVGFMFREMNAVVAGVILGLVYFSDLARRFEPAPVQGVAPPGRDSPSRASPSARHPVHALQTSPRERQLRSHPR